MNKENENEKTQFLLQCMRTKVHNPEGVTVPRRNEFMFGCVYREFLTRKSRGALPKHSLYVCVCVYPIKGNEMCTKGFVVCSQPPSLSKESIEVDISSETESIDILRRISRSLSTGSVGVSTHLSKSLRLA